MIFKKRFLEQEIEELRRLRPYAFKYQSEELTKKKILNLRKLGLDWRVDAYLLNMDMDSLKKRVEYIKSLGIDVRELTKFIRPRMSAGSAFLMAKERLDERVKNLQKEGIELSKYPELILFSPEWINERIEIMKKAGHKVTPKLLSYRDPLQGIRYHQTYIREWRQKIRESPEAYEKYLKRQAGYRIKKKKKYEKSEEAKYKETLKKWREIEEKDIQKQYNIEYKRKIRKRMEREPAFAERMRRYNREIALRYRQRQKKKEELEEVI
jgi:hypothetical protein